MALADLYYSRQDSGCDLSLLLSAPSGWFTVFYWNCFGTFTNELAICALLEAGQFSVIALVESWLVVLPRRVAAAAAAATKYMPLVLPALPSTNGHGRNCQGTIVFVGRN